MIICFVKLFIYFAMLAIFSIIFIFIVLNFGIMLILCNDPFGQFLLIAVFYFVTLSFFFDVFIADDDMFRLIEGSPFFLVINNQDLL